MGLGRLLCSGKTGAELSGAMKPLEGLNMKDVKVDVRVNVDLDAASVVLLLASAATALFLYKQHKQEKVKLHGQ